MANAGVLVIQGGTLIDGTGRPPVENSMIVIEGDRFKAVGINGQTAIPPGSEIIDVKVKRFYRVLSTGMLIGRISTTRFIFIWA